MADDKEVVFEVNAGQILAKLHLGCVQMYKGKVKFYNSGITGKDDGTPESPGDCMFDMKNKTGQYEIGCELEDFYIVRNISQQEIDKLKNKMIKPEKKDMSEDALKKKKDELQKKLEKLANKKENIEFKPYKAKADFEKGMLELAFKYIKEYLENFCGKQNASKLKKEELVQLFIDDSFDGKYDNYTIPNSEKADDLLLKKNDELVEDALDEIDSKVTNIIDAEKFITDNYEKTDKFFKDNMCIYLKDLKIKLAFKTGYEVELETM